MATPTSKPTVFTGFSGLVNTMDLDQLEPGDLQKADNLDLNDGKKAKCRAGWGTVKTAGNFRSGWSDGPDCFALMGTSLVRVNADYSTTALATVGTNDRLAVARAPGRIYWMTNSAKGAIEGNTSRSWGMDAPVFAAASIPGTMPNDEYRVTVTFVRGGQESGALNGQRISGTGIRVTMPAGEKNIYCTGPDGTAYFLAANTTALTFDILSVPDGPELDTQFCIAPPLGHIIAYWKGRMLIAVNDALFWTPAFRLEVVRPDTSFVRFGERIRIVAPFEGGIYIGTSTRHFLLSGNDPTKWQPLIVANYGAIEGTLAVNFSNPGQDATDGQVPTPVWTTRQGIVMGKPGGLVNVTEARYRFGEAQRGSAVIRSYAGFRQYLTVMNQAAPATDAAY